MLEKYEQEQEAEEAVLLATLTTFALIKGRKLEEINVIGNFIVAVGSLMLTYAAQLEAFNVKAEEQKKEKNNKTHTDNHQEVLELKRRLEQVEQALYK